MDLPTRYSPLSRVRRSATARTLAVGLTLLPILHPIFRGALGPPSHLLWFVHVFPVAWATYVWGVRGAAATILASALTVFAGESAFGAGYGHPADMATRWALLIAVGATEVLVSAFAQWIRSAERDRSDLQRLATTALESSQDAVLLLDERQQVRYADTVAAATFGTGGPRLTGRPITAILEGGLERQDVTSLGAGRWDTVAHAGSGDLIPVEVRVTPVPDAGGRPGAWLVVIRDRTEELRHEEADRRAQALSELGTVVAGVAHELNNPLTTVGTYAEILEGYRGALSPEVAEAVDSIAHESRRAVAIVRQLLRDVRHRTTRARGTLELNAVVVRALDAGAPVFAAHGIRVTRRLAPDLPPVEGNGAEIEQILANLLSNARYAMHQAHGRGRLVVTSRREGDTELIEVEDDGPGIPDVVVPHVFEPFFSTKGLDGNGLGLAIARRIAREHRGDLWVEGVATGGARFVLALPVSRREAPAPAAPPAEPRGSPAPAASGLSVLIVDDEPGIRRSLCRFLEARGHRVVVAADVGRARQLLADGAYDAVLCDVHLPGGSGMDLYHALKGTRPQLLTRFALMTGDVLSPEVASFLRETECPHLAKPFETAEVVALLERLATHAVPA